MSPNKCSAHTHAHTSNDSICIWKMYFNYLVILNGRGTWIDCHHRSTSVDILYSTPVSSLLRLWLHETATTLIFCGCLFVFYWFALALWCNDAFIIQSFSHPINRYFDITNLKRHQHRHTEATHNKHRYRSNNYWVYYPEFE